MHVLQVEAVADIVHTLPVMIVMKTFCSDYLVNFRFGGQSLAAYVRLRKNATE